MSLQKKQARFARMVANLILYADRIGYDVTFGEAYRSDEQAVINAKGATGREDIAQRIEATHPDLAAALRNNGKAAGIAASLHCDRLAVDLMLFRRDATTGEAVYLPRTVDHKPLGEFWESIGGTWGGRFGDGNHYSLGHGGRK
jgi:hypothetical protein